MNPWSFTCSGLKSRFEINVVSRDSTNYQEAYKIFEELSKDSVKIVDKDNFDSFFYNVVEKTWLKKLPNPFLLYVRVLNEYFWQYSADKLIINKVLSKVQVISKLPPVATDNLIILNPLSDLLFDLKYRFLVNTTRPTK